MNANTRLFPEIERPVPVEADPHAQIVLTGEVSYIVFSSVESGFRVLRVKLDESCGGKGTVIAGRSSMIRVGDRIRAVGRWKQSKYGLQLDAESIAALDAVTVDGFARSLDGLVPGLGSARARRFVDALGGAEKTIDVLDQICSSMPRRDPALVTMRTEVMRDRLVKLEALAASTMFDGEREAAQIACKETRARLRDLSDVDTDVRRLVDDPATLIGSCSWLPLPVRVDLVLAWRESRVEREVEAQLASLNLPVGLRARLIARYGADAARIVLKEPYRLTTEVEGVGFLTADDVALKTGVGVDSLDRVDAAVIHVLREQAEDGGHTVSSTVDVSRSIFQLFMQRRPPASVVEDGASCVVQAIERLIEKKRVVLGPAGTGVCLPELARAEETIAKMLGRLLSAERPPIEFAGAVDPSLTDEQQLAVRAVFERGVGVLTGGPGTGKSRTSGEIVRVARSLGLHVALCAPTARAAKRLSEMADGQVATTIHRLLEAKGTGRFDRNIDNPIEADLILGDEMSMTEVSLMAAFLSAVHPKARLLLVGDVDQLPPVGPGAPFRDIIASGEVPVARLTKIHRQAEGSAVVRAAHGVLRGTTPTSSPEGERGDGCLHLVKQSNPAEAAKLVVRIVLGLREELGVDPWDTMVISPMRKGDCGVVALNTMLQRAMNPPRDDLPEIGYGKEEMRRIFRQGDRVRQTKNDYERGVVNGDVGRIIEVYPEKNRPRGGPWLDVDFPGVGVVHYDGAQLAHLVLAYCSTVHANQGSESPAVVLALVDQHYVMLTRTLLYTAITRAKKACIIVGSKRALETAARNAKDDKRRTTLPARLLAKSRG
jgi:exodeoxyribonuclease V alpha subunit